jgi:2-polyprenyl-3-methyl-5-hydroxy-6-metoxy-1,4-benzoquinol methylase
VSLELHGHRKKLRFIARSLERYALGNALAASQVRVLEVGCSNGRNITTPLALLGYQVTGLDIHRESIDYARAHTPVPNARFLCQDLAELDAGEQFEAIILSDVLEHVEDPAWLCVESMKHIVSGGIVLISIPNGYGPFELEQRFLKATRADQLVERTRHLVARLLRRPSARVGYSVQEPAYNYDSGHVQFFHLKDFKRLLDRVGLRVVEQSRGALLGGALSMQTLGRFPSLVAASLRVADFLPMRWVTTWYFCCVASAPSAQTSGRRVAAAVPHHSSRSASHP